MLTTTDIAVVSALSLTLLVATWRFTSEDSFSAQIELLLLFLSIPVAWFGHTFVACALNATGNILHMDQRFTGVSGFDFTYATHWSLLVTTILVILVGFSTMIQFLTYVLKRHTHTFLRTATGMWIVAVLSIQSLLTLLTLALSAGYNGSLHMTVQNWTTAGYEYSVQHSLTFFFAAAVYASRYETGDEHGISVRLRRVAWYYSPAIVAAMWGIALLASQKISPYTKQNEDFSFWTAVVAAVVPWLVIGAGA
jgi:hypothetical protein